MKLLDDNIFNITHFVLFKPKTRNYSNEVFITTLLSNIGLKAPRTSWFNVKYNENIYKYIFQEKVNKEFLEHNKLIEGPLYSGDERFLFKFDPKSEFVGLGVHRLINGDWAIKNEINFNVAKQKLNFLNYLLTSYDYEKNDLIDYQDLKNNLNGVIETLDYPTSLKKTKFHKTFKEQNAMDALIFALGANHGLSAHNRKYYFDSINQKFIPIYNDGWHLQSGIFDFNNNLIINDNKKTLINGNEFKISTNFINSFSPFEFIQSYYDGADDVINLVNNLNNKNILYDLKLRGLSIDEKSLNIIKRKIISNLKKIKKKKKNNYLSSFINNKKNILSRKITDENKFYYIFYNNEKQIYEVCNLKIKNCKLYDSNKFNRKNLLEQRINFQDKKAIYLGEKHLFNSNEKIEKFYLQDYDNEIFNNIIKADIKIIGNVIVDTNYENKEIFIKTSNGGKILFVGGNFNNWKISITSTDNYVNKKYISRDMNGLSGCLNFINSKFDNIKIHSINQSCEDAVNIIRSKGDISEIKVFNSQNDAVDFDFSSINIDKVVIDKSGNDCIDISYGKFFILHLDLKNCGDKALSLGENSNLSISDIFINNSYHGIVSKDSSFLSINNARLSNVNTCMLAYRKKIEFTGASIFYKKIDCKIYDEFKFIEGNSIIEQNG